MRNVKDQDVENGNLRKNVMYLVEHPWFNSVLAHIKEHVQVNGEWVVAMETSDGCPIIAEYSWLKAVPRKSGTPAKPKRTHVRETKPWLSNCVPYDPKLIKIGTRVLCRDGNIRVVDITTRSSLRIGGHYVDIYTGLGNYITKSPHYCDIMKVFIDKETDQPKKYLEGDFGPELFIPHKYNGYSVGKWHFWEGKTDVPPVDGDVEIWCRNGETSEGLEMTKKSSCWSWKNSAADYDIIAFKIIEQ